MPEILPDVADVADDGTVAAGVAVGVVAWNEGVDGVADAAAAGC